MVAVLLSLISCKGEETKTNSENEKSASQLYYASVLKLYNHPEGWWEAQITNPWDTATLLQSLALVPHTTNVTELNLPDNLTLIRIPLKKTLVTSTVHVGIIEEFGKEDAIAGITDEDYIKSPKIKAKLDNSEIFVCGSWMSPDIEKIIKLSPDAILLSPYQNGGNYGNITELGIPIIYVADYMENTPLGRAEWLKYYGLLYGKEKLTDSIFKATEEKYFNLKNLCKKESDKKGKKKIIMDLPYSGTWQVPSGGSTNDYFIQDVSGINPFSSLSGNPFARITPEKGFYDAQDADVWIIRQNSIKTLSLKQLEKDFPFAPKFKAYQKGNVWACNTNESHYFEDTPFHPEKIMEDLYRILYLQDPPDSLNYFNRLK